MDGRRVLRGDGGKAAQLQGPVKAVLPHPHTFCRMTFSCSPPAMVHPCGPHGDASPWEAEAEVMMIVTTVSFQRMLGVIVYQASAPVQICSPGHKGQDFELCHRHERLF